MAAILLGAGALAYDQVKKSKEKRAAKKVHNDERFASLERETTNRLASAPATCSCTSPTWPGGECPTHGDVPAPTNSRSARARAQSSTSSFQNHEPTSASPTSPRFGGGIGNGYHDHHHPRKPGYSDVTEFKPGMAQPSSTIAARSGSRTGDDARRPSYKSQSSAISGNFVSISSGAAGGGGGSKNSGAAAAAGHAEDRDRINDERRHAGKTSWWKRKGNKKGGAPEIGEGMASASGGDGIVR